MTIAENVAKDKGILRKDRITQGWYEKFMKRQTYLSLCKGDPAANNRMDESHGNLLESNRIGHY